MLRIIVWLLLFLPAAVLSADDILTNQVDPDLCLTIAIAVQNEDQLLVESAYAELKRRELSFEACPAIVEQAMNEALLKYRGRARWRQRVQEDIERVKKNRYPDRETARRD